MALSPQLEAELEKWEMELRGFEVAKRTPDGWESVGRYRANDMGLAAAKRSANYLNWQSGIRRGQPYAVRPIVSISVEMTASPDDALVEAKDVGDIIPTEPFDHEAAKEEAVKAATELEDQLVAEATAADLELAAQKAADDQAGGFITQAGVVPLNYAEEAANAQLNFDFSDVGGEG